jgi:hypothetical protein
LRRRLSSIFGIVGLAAAMLAIGAPISAAEPPAPEYKAECTSHPGVTTSGDQVVFSGFIRCEPYINGGTTFVLAYVGDREGQEFKQRTDRKCPIDKRCDGTPISLPNPPGLQTYCSSTEAFVGVTQKTVEIVREQFCSER